MPDRIDEQIAAIAGQQQNNITRRQLLRLGLGRNAIAHRARNGRLFRAHLGVYGVGRPPKTVFERASAAVLACGPGAALCGPSAFTLWGFDKHWRFPVHVCGPVKRTRPGIVTHKFSSLARRDVRTELGIRVTSPARTFLDCAPTMTREQLRRAFADGRRSGHLKRAALHDILDRNPTHPGHTPLLEAFTGHQPTRSQFEDAFLDFCRDYDLPKPIINRKTNGHEVDIRFPGHDVMIELDGWDYHQDRYSFEGDRDRDADQLATGQPTVRWIGTHPPKRITETPAREARRLHPNPGALQ